MLRRCLPLLLLAVLAGCGPTTKPTVERPPPEDSGVDKTLAGKGPPGPAKMIEPPADTGKKDEKAATPPTEK